ncbi:MAG: NUDIX domain-containing protein [Candidatus Gracilibacteria bacterium]|jgi:8-oxo-dGTP diphosphatase
MIDFFSRRTKKPAIATDSVIFTIIEDKLHVLLIERKNDPFKDKWALPGGFMEWEESTKQSAARELAEETGLKGVQLEQFGVFDKPGRDPRGTVVSIEFCGLVRAENVEPKGADDAKIAQWFAMNDLPDLAFDHAEVLKAALKSMQQKETDYHWFKPLLPGEFTLAELHKIFTIALGKKLDKRNLLRLIQEQKLLTPVLKTKKGRGKPAEVYRMIDKN